MAYLNNDNSASAWFTVGPVAVGAYVLDVTENPLTVAESVALAQYQLLP